MLDSSKQALEMAYMLLGYSRLLLAPPVDTCRNVVDSLLTVKQHKVGARGAGCCEVDVEVPGRSSWRSPGLHSRTQTVWHAQRQLPGSLPDATHANPALLLPQEWLHAFLDEALRSGPPAQVAKVGMPGYWPLSRSNSTMQLMFTYDQDMHFNTMDPDQRA
jgi:hypothetical protein